jgi:UDP-glucose 4-epimerase
MKKSNFSLIRDDILNYDVLAKTMNDVDIVFHLAAQPGVRYSLENPIITNKVNTEGTLNVLEAARKCNVKRVINASSSSVYGNLRYTPVDENHPLNPLSIYGVTKATTENYCRIYSKMHNQYIVNLRYHSVYGPRGRPDMAVYKWIDSLFRKKTITVFGDGTQTRDMTFIDDIVDGTIRSAETEDIKGETFNLASGRNVTMKYILDLMTKLTSLNTKIEYSNFRSDDAKDTHGNIEKAKRILGYKPQTSIEDGISKTIVWYKKKFSN